MECASFAAVNRVCAWSARFKSELTIYGAEGLMHLGAVAMQGRVLEIEDNNVSTLSCRRLTFDECRNLLLVKCKQQKNEVESHHTCSRAVAATSRGMP